MKNETGLKTRYKFIHFVKLEDKPKTSVWSCRNNSSGTELGQVMWYPAWRQYVYDIMNHPFTVYSGGCFKDINHFMEQLR